MYSIKRFLWRTEKSAAKITKLRKIGMRISKQNRGNDTHRHNLWLIDKDSVFKSAT